MMIKLFVPLQMRWGSDIRKDGWVSSMYTMPELPIAYAMGTPKTNRPRRTENIIAKLIVYTPQANLHR